MSFSNKTPVYDKKKRGYISITSALRRGIKENPGDFDIRFNRVLGYNKRQRKYVELTAAQATDGLRNGNYELHKFIGLQNYEDATQTIERPTITTRQKARISSRPVGRMILSPADRKETFILYNFLKKVGATGKGQFIVAQNGRPVFNKDLNIEPTLDKWWEDPGRIFIGMIESDYYIWNVADITKRGNVSRKPIYRLDIKGSKNWQNFTIEEKDDVTRKEKQILDDTKTIFYWVPDTRLPVPTAPKNIFQTFRNNEDKSCFFKGIEKFIEDKLEELEEKSSYRSKERYSAMSNKVDKLKIKYPDGVPQDKIQEISDILGVSFRIRDILNQDFLEIKPSKKPLTTIKYINTEYDHVEIDKYIDNQNNIIEVETQEDLTDLIIQNAQNNNFQYYLGSVLTPSKLHTAEATYQYKNPTNELIKEFNNKTGISNLEIDYNSKTAQFVKEGVNYNSHCQFKQMLEYKKEYIEQNFIEYDLRKAYTQYKKSKFYVGFPSVLTPPIKLTDWSVNKCKKYIGYYHVYIVNITDKNALKILDELNLQVGVYYILSSPEILLLDTYGVEFKFNIGSYSLKPLDFDIPEEMLENRAYCKWAGQLNSHNETDERRTLCSPELSEFLASRYDNVSINEYAKGIEGLGLDKVETKIQFQRDKVYWLGHIGGFITAYTRIIVLDELLKVPHENIIGFKLDGFIVKEPLELPLDLWAVKPTKCGFDWGSGIFLSADYEFKSLDLKFLRLFNNRISFLSGEGGTGKSHMILSNLENVLYVSACWRLNVEKSKEYSCKPLSIHQLLGKGCESYLLKHKPPPIVFVDELTQITSAWIQELIEKLPYSIIFLAGDIDKDGNAYQCLFKDVELFKPSKDIEFINFTTNYRCKDAILLKELRNLRQQMKTCNFNTAKITDYVSKVFKNQIITEEELKQNYNTNTDWVLCSVTEGERSQTKYYTDLLQGNKYLCIKHKSEHIFKRLAGEEIPLRGDITDTLPKDIKRFQKQEAFTIHSFQGITIKKGSTLYIDLKRIFSPRQLYTALSRVEYLEQIKLLN